MKKLFTIDDFMVAFISALGYGFGYTIPMYLGWPQPACIAVCFALVIFLNDKQPDRSEVETLASVRCKSDIKLRFIEERYDMTTRFSKTLKMLRTERGISQIQFAEQLFVDRSTISRWESGNRIPDNMMIARLAKLLDVDINFLLNAAAECDETPKVGYYGG